MSKFGCVVTFRENENGTFEPTGKTKIYDFMDALILYSEIPNPSSQLVEGDSEKEIMTKIDYIVKKMADKKYVEEYNKTSHNM